MFVLLIDNALQVHKRELIAKYPFLYPELKSLDSWEFAPTFR